MIRPQTDRKSLERCKPRASGDDPLSSKTRIDNEGVNPARAGMILG